MGLKIKGVRPLVNAAKGGYKPAKMQSSQKIKRGCKYGN